MVSRCHVSLDHLLLEEACTYVIAVMRPYHASAYVREGPQELPIQTAITI